MADNVFKNTADNRFQATSGNHFAASAESITASLSAAAVVSGTIQGVVQMAASVAAACSLTPTLSGPAPVSALIQASCRVSGRTGIPVHVGTDIAAASAVSAALNAALGLQAAISASAQLNALVGAGLVALTQAERAELRRVEPLHLVDLAAGGLTLRLSDRDFRYRYGSAEILYESYIQGISGLSEVADPERAANSRVSIALKNQAWGDYDHLSQIDAAYPLSRALVTIWELRLVEGETRFLRDERTCLWKGTVEQVERVSREGFALACSSRLYDKRDSLGVSKLTKTVYPNADPDDVGKWRNMLYGGLEQVPCRAAVAGAMDTLAQDISAGAGTIVVSGTTKISFPSSGTIQIDEEQIRYTSFSSFTFGGCTRGANGTTAAPHSKGRGVFQVLSEYVYELGSHAIRTVSNVYVDGVRQTSGATSYTGQAGNEKPGFGSRAVVAFAVKPVIKKQVNITVASEHSHATNPGSHNHGMSAVATYRKNLDGIAGEGQYTNLAAMWDGNDYSAGSIGSNTGGGAVTLGIPADGAGSILRVDVWIKMSCSITGGTNARGRVRFGIGEIVFGSRNLGWYRHTFTVGLGWTADPWVQAEFYSSSDYAVIWIYEAYVEYTYVPAVNNAPASGVNTALLGATTLGGNSSADTVIGQEVAADCEGWRDDASGRITGTPNALIERPDHVFKHILVDRLGISAADIGASFSTAGTFYASNNYKFAFVVHDIATDAQRLLFELARQCRSVLYEWGGKFELKVLPDSAPAADLTLEEADWAELPVFDYTPSGELRNKLRAFYRRDYRGRRSGGAEYSVAGVDPDALARGYMDMLEASSGAGDLEGELMLNAVRTSAMAQDVMAFWLARWATPRLTIAGRLSWRAIQLAPGSYVAWTDPMMGSRTYRVMEFRPDRQAGVIHIKAEEA